MSGNDRLKCSFCGKTQDQVKKLIAGLIIFLLPTALDFMFDSLLQYDDSAFTACSNCLFDTGNCSIPTTDPNTYTN